MVLAEIVAAAAAAAQGAATAVGQGAAAAGQAAAQGAAAAGQAVGQGAAAVGAGAAKGAAAGAKVAGAAAEAAKAAPQMTGTPLQRFSSRFVSGFSEGLKAESERRAKAGLSGGGLGKAFAEGVQPVNDFTALINQEALAGMKALAFKSLGATLNNERAANNKLASDAASNQEETEDETNPFDAETE
tara:strand:+ start:4765 stop:5325 length:561 start_codon:yes stop_codon:yes gene_type:complete